METLSWISKDSRNVYGYLRYCYDMDVLLFPRRPKASSMHDSRWDQSKLQSPVNFGFMWQGLALDAICMEFALGLALDAICVEFPVAA